MNTSVAVLAGFAIATASAAGAEVWWQLIRPRTAPQFTACWMAGILTRVIVALAGLAICLGLLDLAAPPLVLALVVGYAAILAVETRVTLRRMRRISTQ
jgi:hypothetical protein